MHYVKFGQYIHTPHSSELSWPLHVYPLIPVLSGSFQFLTLSLQNSDKTKSRGIDCDRAHSESTHVELLVKRRKVCTAQKLQSTSNHQIRTSASTKS